MGSDHPLGREDELPMHRVRVDGFWIDPTEVTNRQFQEFVDATGYVTTAEVAPDLEEIMSQQPPGTPPPDPSLLVPGSMVFNPPTCPSRWTTSGSGGSGLLEQVGGIPRGPAVTLMDARITRSCRFPGSTQSHTANGPASGCQLKRSGSLPPAADSSSNRSSGAKRHSRKLSRRPTSSRANSRIGIRGRTVSSGLPRSSRSRRTVMACSTWPATSGNGAATGTGPTPTRSGPGRHCRQSHRSRQPPRSPPSPHAAACPTGRLVSLQRRLLCQLPPGRANAQLPRHRDVARRLSLRRNARHA